MTAAVDLTNVSVRRGEALAVNRVSLSVLRGSWFGLIGANGSGKTSLLRALCGRLAIASGKCVIDGQPAPNRVARAQAIALPHRSKACRRR